MGTEDRPEQWVRLCSVAEAPAEGAVMEAEVEGVAVCLARLGGELRAVDNLCPHRQGPLGQGWLEGNTVVCPWHSWAFNLQSGQSEYPEGHSVTVFSVREDASEVLVRLA